MNRYAAALLIVMVVAGLLGRGSASDDQAQHEHVEKPER